jgi:hypothetical protein
MTARDRARLVAGMDALGTAALPCIRLHQEFTARSRGLFLVGSSCCGLHATDRLLATDPVELLDRQGRAAG